MTQTLCLFLYMHPSACDYTCCISMCFIRVSKVALLQSDRHRMTTGELDPQGLGGEADTEPDQDNKYVKRTGSVKRSLQRVMPAIFQPTLPVTTRYAILCVHVQFLRHVRFLLKYVFLATLCWLCVWA